MKHIQVQIQISIFCLVFSSFPQIGQSQNHTAIDIIEKADKKQRGDYSQGEMKMSIIRPDWSRETTMKMWSYQDDLSLILVTEPARDQGTAFLKRFKEMWNWQPSIDRTIKMPPSMMSQSWMGSDFTNDDLVKQSSMVVDYTHEITGEDDLEGRPCWEITLTPKDDAAVVWGKVITWIDHKDYLQLKTEFYDEDDYLVNTMTAKEITDLGGRILPRIMEMVPADEEGHMTKIEYLSLDFSKPIKESFFSVRNMQKVR
tara:strand:- start:1646 stop:2416 length:771 start_codon:yes stop_codon:yes gene_type:complete